MKTTFSARARRRVAACLFGAGLLVAPVAVSAQPAAASQCDPELQTVCGAVGTVICKVAAKGNPCLK